MSERYSRCETCGGSVCECTAEEIIKAALAKNPKLTMVDFFNALAANFDSVVKKREAKAKAEAFTEAAQICHDEAAKYDGDRGSDAAGSLADEFEGRAESILESINQKPA